MKTGAETSQTSETMQERELTAIRPIASVDKMDGQHSTRFGLGWVVGMY